MDILTLKKAQKYTDKVAATKADKSQEAWITPTLLNGWTAVVGSDIKYRKNTIGEVSIVGRITGGTISTTVFTLPLGYQPLNSLYFTVPYGGSSASFTKGVILTTGVVIVYGQNFDCQIDVKFKAV